VLRWHLPCVQTLVHDRPASSHRPSWALEGAVHALDGGGAAGGGTRPERYRTHASVATPFFSRNFHAAPGSEPNVQPRLRSSQLSMSCGERGVTLPLRTHTRSESESAAAKAQHKPHYPWSRIGAWHELVGRRDVSGGGATLRRRRGFVDFRPLHHGARGGRDGGGSGAVDEEEESVSRQHRAWVDKSGTCREGRRARGRGKGGQGG
jgi:hypothetical protein